MKRNHSPKPPVFPHANARVHVPFFPWVLSKVQHDVASLWHLLLYTGWTKGAQKGGYVLTPGLPMTRIAERFGVTGRTVQRWLQEAEGSEVVRRMKVKGHESRYRVFAPEEVFEELAALSKGQEASMKAFSLVPRKSRNDLLLRAGKSVERERRYSKVGFVAWYYRTVKRLRGVRLSGASGDLRIQFERHLAPIWNDARVTKGMYDVMYSVAEDVVRDWDNLRGEWGEERRRRMVEESRPLPRHPPLAFIGQWWHRWKAKYADAGDLELAKKDMQAQLLDSKGKLSMAKLKKAWRKKHTG